MTSKKSDSNLKDGFSNAVTAALRADLIRDFEKVDARVLLDMLGTTRIHLNEAANYHWANAERLGLPQGEDAKALAQVMAVLTAVENLIAILKAYEREDPFTAMARLLHG
jgi:hypothetical protein